MRSSRSRVVIVSPALRAANNGNWHTANRWSRMLRPRFDVEVCSEWMPQRAPQCMIALHARRSADAVARHAEAWPDSPRIVVLTGTDLYRDLPRDAVARRSLDLATQLVVLQEAALDHIQPEYRSKCRVIYQSAPPLAPGKPRTRTFDVVMVGHMRAEKDPATPMRAIMRLSHDSKVRLVHIGEALTDEYARMARELMHRSAASVQRYCWLGPRAHAETRRRIRDARAMVISSVMEGGANVIVEAVVSGVPVLASRISGNVGMLGANYDGYFAVGDDGALAQLMDRVSRDAAFLDHLRKQCAARAALFDPAHERANVNDLVRDALGTGHEQRKATSISGSKRFERGEAQ